MGPATVVILAIAKSLLLTHLKHRGPPPPKKTAARRPQLSWVGLFSSLPRVRYFLQIFHDLLLPVVKAPESLECTVKQSWNVFRRNLSEVH